mgnify:CR=1 FL=1
MRRPGPALVLGLGACTVDPQVNAPERLSAPPTPPVGASVEVGAPHPLDSPETLEGVGTLDYSLISASAGAICNVHWTTELWDPPEHYCGSCDYTWRAEHTVDPASSSLDHCESIARDLHFDLGVGYGYGFPVLYYGIDGDFYPWMAAAWSADVLEFGASFTYDYDTVDDSYAFTAELDGALTF